MGEAAAALSRAREAVDRAAVTDGLTMHADALLDLAAVLDAAVRAPGDIARGEVNLVQLVSRPRPDSPWRYRFDAVLGILMVAAVVWFVYDRWKNRLRA